MNRPPAHVSFIMLACLLAPQPAVRAQHTRQAAQVVSGADVCAEGKRQTALRAFRQAAGASLSGASPHFDATYYHLLLDLDFETPYLRGRAHIEGRVADEPMQALVLDFDDHMQVDSVYAAGTRLAFSHADALLHIDLAGRRNAGETLALDVFYQGLPRQSGFGAFAFGRHSDDDPYAWTLSEPYGARLWWPCKDHPSDKADSVRVTVSVPEGLRVGSNGLLREATPAYGRVTYDWFSRYPIATYLVSLAAGKYHAFEQVYRRPDSLAAAFGPLEMPVLHYVYEKESDALPEGWAQVTDVLAVLEYWFGPYPFGAEKYGHAQFTWGGGMEHQTMSSMGRFEVGLVTHELGHMWFGDLVTLHAWPQLWLNEGFATYAELLYWQARSEAYPGTYEKVQDSYWNRARQAQGTLIVEDTTSISNLFDGRRVYAKGGMVLHMLRHVVGDAPFRDLLRAYTRDPAVRYGTATTADFQRVAETSTGRDLDVFFRQWVTEGTGYPEYQVRWTSREAAAGFDVDVEVEQVQTLRTSNVEVFVMPVTLTVRTEQREHRFRVLNDQRKQRFTLFVPGRPTAVVFDPDRALLRNEDVLATAGEPSSGLTQQPALTAVYPDPTSGPLNVTFTLARAGAVRLALHDALGRRVRVLLSERLPVGNHQATFAVADLASGLYYLHLDDGRSTSVCPVTVLRVP